MSERLDDAKAVAIIVSPLVFIVCVFAITDIFKPKAPIQHREPSYKQQRRIFPDLCRCGACQEARYADLKKLPNVRSPSPESH